jgi:hypothetical protein
MRNSPFEQLSGKSAKNGALRESQIAFAVNPMAGLITLEATFASGKGRLSLAQNACEI